MNEIIEQMFENFTVEGERVPVSFLYYDGHANSYVTYMSVDMDNSLSGDDTLLGYVEYYDFDVYSKGNFYQIINTVKQVMKDHGFVFQLARTSRDMYETDTGYFHKTLCFAIPRGE